MRKILTVLLLLVTSVSAYHVWTAAINSDFNNAGNWSPNLSPTNAPNDTFIFDGTSNINATMSAAAIMASLKFRSYSGTFTENGYKITVGWNVPVGDTAFFWGALGTLNTGTTPSDTLTLLNGRWVINSTGSASFAWLVLNQTGSGWLAEPEVFIRQYIGAASGQIDTINDLFLGQLYVGSPMFITGSGTLVMYQYIIIAPVGTCTDNSSVNTIITSPTTNTAYIAFEPYNAAVTDTIRAIQFPVGMLTSTVGIWETGINTTQLAGRLSASTIAIASYGTSVTTKIFNANSYGITATSSFQYGPSTSSLVTSNWGTSFDTIPSFLPNGGGTATGPDTMYLQQSNWTVKGNWSNNWTGFAEVPGTSTINFTTNPSTLTSNNYPFYSLHWNNTGLNDSLADSVQADSLTIDHGLFKMGGHNAFLKYWFAMNGSDSMVAKMPAHIAYSQEGIFKINTSGTVTDTGLTLLPSKALTMVLSQSIKLAEVVLAKARTIFQAGKTLTLQTINNTDMSGTNSSAMDTLQSSLSGTQATIAFTGSPTVTLSYASVKDIAFTGQTGSVWCTTGCLDKGGNSGIYFKQLTISVMSPYTGPIAGGTVVSFTGELLVAPCSLSVNGGATYFPVTITDTAHGTATMPSNTVGPVAITVKAPAGTFTRNNAFIYRTVGSGNDTLVLQKQNNFTFTSLDSLDWSGAAATASGRNYVLSSQNDTLSSSRDTIIIPYSIGFSNLYLRNQTILNNSMRCKTGCKSGGGNY